MVDGVKGRAGGGNIIGGRESKDGVVERGCGNGGDVDSKKQVEDE